MLHILARGETHSAKVVWRHHDRAGVALSSVDNVEVPFETAKRIREAENENRRLRRQLDPTGW
jgi:hypothetical protein